jgi:hypothetical protein
LAACRIYSVLSGVGDLAAARNKWLLLSFRKISPGDEDLQAAQSEAGLILQGKIYAARLCRFAGVPSEKIDPRTEQMPIIEEVRFFASPISSMVLIKRATDPQFAASPSEP